MFCRNSHHLKRLTDAGGHDVEFVFGKAKERQDALTLVQYHPNAEV